MFKISYLKLFLSIIICQLPGIFGSLFTASSVSDWYQLLNKPSFSPPGWIFGPVWITLYFLMGISLYLVWTSKTRNKTLFKTALIIFSVQLVLNAFWSLLFFGLKSPLFAFIEIIILWISIVLSIIYFYRISKLSSYLLIPYLLWVTFASVLNFSIYFLNP